jgi:flagellar motor switch protein FliG
MEAAASASDTELADLTGAERAALFLLLVGEEAGREVWSMLEEDEVRMVTHAMVALGTVKASAVESLLVEFIGQLSNGALAGSLERTEALLLKFFPPDQVASIMAEVSSVPGRRIWGRLSQVDPSVLGNFLRSEYPQTVAVILSKLPKEYSARVLTTLPDEFAIDIVSRMLRLEPVQKEALKHLEEMLRDEFVGAISTTSKPDAHEDMAEIFNSLDRQTESRYFSMLDQIDYQSSKRIRELMFTFEDLAKLDAGSMQTLLRFVDRDVLSKALKGVSERLIQAFLKNMSTRAAKNLEDAVTSLGPIKLKDVDEAQANIVRIAKDLADKGDIAISKNSVEDELVY